MTVWLGFITGILGSIHCLGMCGPIALALPADTKSKSSMLAGRSLYNLGRSITYAGLGAIAGLLGFSINSIGSQQFLSILMGVIIILMALFPTKFMQRLFPFLNASAFPPKLKAIFTNMLKEGSPKALFVIGLLNGLLPCGLVYMALAGAMAMGNLTDGILFMFLFGLGTTPAMFAISLAGNMIGLSLRKKFNRIIPYFGIILGLLFILRGMNLGIPFLSPSEQKVKHMMEQKKDGSGTMKCN